MNRSAMRANNPKKIRDAAQVSASMEKQLLAYAVSATAAAVAVLSMGQLAQSKIIYTPAHKLLPNHKLFYLDLNHDGINDFKLSLSFSTQRMSTNTFWQRSLKVDGVRQNNQIWAFGTNPSCAEAVPSGIRIGPKAPFRQGSLQMFRGLSSHSTVVSSCPWAFGKRAYLGLKFSVNGKVHYGWARFATQTYHQTVAELTGYAYETIPGKAIDAGATKGLGDTEPTAALNPRMPEPATLGMLAVGAPGLSIWRRKESDGVALESN
jgi:hypothetical protein